MKKGLFVLAMLILAFNSFGQNSSLFTGNEFNESGIKKFAVGDKQGAIIDFTRAIEIRKEFNPDSSALSTLYLMRGWSKNDLKDYKGAILDFTEGINLFNEKILINNSAPSVPLTLLSYAYYLRAYASINESLNNLNETIMLFDQNGKLYLARGDIKILLKQKESACQDYSRARELGVEDAFERIKENCNN